MKLPALLPLLTLLTLPLLALAGAHAQSAATLPTTTPLPTTAAPDSTAITAPAPAPACAHPFGLYDNMELLYRITDAAGKPQGELRQRVVRLGSELNKKKTRTTTTVLLKSGLYDDKNHLQQQQDLTFRCSRDTTYTDGLTLFDQESLKSFRERIFDFAPVKIAWPNSPAIGSSLPDGGSVVQVRSSAVDIAKVSSLVRKRKVVSGPTALKTPAGTFQCYRVESEREAMTRAKADVAFGSSVKEVDYYTPGVGIVKTEVYDKKGKLARTYTLSQISKGK